MKGVKPSVRALCSALTVCIIFFTGNAAFADNNAPSAAKSKHYLEEAVEKMVQEGSLTREKADKILEYKNNHPTGIITQKVIDLFIDELNFLRTLKEPNND